MADVRRGVSVPAGENTVPGIGPEPSVFDVAPAVHFAEHRAERRLRTDAAIPPSARTGQEAAVMARVSVTVWVGIASSVRLRSCRSTPAGRKANVLSVQRQYEQSGNTDGCDRLAARIRRPGRPVHPRRRGRQCGRGQQQQRAVAQAGKIARALGRGPHEPGGGWSAYADTDAVRLCRRP